MCGIAGWIDYDRDLTSQRRVAAAMNDALACRGPDGRGEWSATRAVLGHTRNAVIDIPGGGQPMVAEADGRTLAVLTYNGEVYNFRELRLQLEGRGHTFHTDCDTEVVLRAYLEWGDRCGEHLVGMFAFGVWDALREELVLVRDHMGIKPLFYAPTPGGLVFGSEAKALFASGLVSPEVDADGLRELLAQTKTHGTSVYAGIREVRPGHVLRVRRGGMAERCYWRIEARPHVADLATTVATVRAMLEEQVAEQLVADVPVGVLLSGGLDSSALAALADRDLRARGAEPLQTFGLTFANYAERFRPDEVRATPDAPYAGAMARALGAEHHEIVLDSAQLMDPAVRLAALRCQDLPSPMGDGDASIYLFSREVRRHVVVALSGETADEVFGGFNWLHIPQLAGAATFPWVAIGQLVAPDFPGLGCGLLDRGLLAELDIPAYTADHYRQALAEVPRLAGEDPTDRRMRELVHLHLTRWLPGLLERTDRLAMASALELRVPYCDHRFLQYVFDVPWSMKSAGGQPKGLLRAAAADLLPTTIAERKKAPYPVTQDRGYALALCEAFRRLAADPNAPVGPFYNAPAAAGLLDAPGNLEAGTGAWLQRANLEMVLNLNDWIEHYDVRLSL